MNKDFSPVPGPAEEVDVPASTDSSTSTLPIASDSAFRSAFSFWHLFPLCLTYLLLYHESIHYRITLSVKTN